jgi:hypothetical protein
MEPNYDISNIIAVLLPFCAYFFGIFLRAKVIPKPSHLSMLKQFLLGIPVSLVVVTPMLTVFQNTMHDYSFLVTLGPVIEQGMLVNQTLTQHLHAIIKGGNG